jgi:uncharacterized protein (DUF983 family)
MSLCLINVIVSLLLLQMAHQREMHANVSASVWQHLVLFSPCMLGPAYRSLVFQRGWIYKQGSTNKLKRQDFAHRKYVSLIVIKVDF